MSHSRATSVGRMRGLAIIFCLLVWGGRAVPAVAQAASAFAKEIKLTPDDGAPEDSFGSSVSLSGDVALVGAWLDDDNGEDSGAAYVFVRDGDAWRQEAKLTPDDGSPIDLFGSAVALSGDRALIGAPTEVVSGRIGAAYVFVRDGGTWHQEAKLTAADGAPNNHFGRSVTLLGDVALIGAVNDNDFSGSAYVFVRDGATWHQEAKLSPDDATTGHFFGRSVSLSGDRALIGADGDDANGFTSGAAYVFVRDGGTWQQEAKLTPDDSTPVDLFGFSVSLSGNVALVGSYLDDDDGIDSGSAYVFTFDGATWQQTEKLTPDDGDPENTFGINVSLSGERALIGAAYDDHQGYGTGSAYVFAFDGTSWQQTEKLVAADAAANDFFGGEVSLSEDVALIGA